MAITSFKPLSVQKVVVACSLSACTVAGAANLAVLRLLMW